MDQHTIGHDIQKVGAASSQLLRRIGSQCARDDRKKSECARHYSQWQKTATMGRPLVGRMLSHNFKLQFDSQTVHYIHTFL